MLQRAMASGLLSTSFSVVALVKWACVSWTRSGFCLFWEAPQDPSYKTKLFLPPSFHVGSDCPDPQAYAQSIADARLVFEMGTELGHRMHILDLGGGFPGVEGPKMRFEEVTCDWAAQRAGVCGWGGIVSQQLLHLSMVRNLFLTAYLDFSYFLQPCVCFS